MKWSYTNGKLNVSSEDIDQQFTLQELIEEASRHQAYRKKIVALFLLIFEKFVKSSNLPRRLSHQNITDR